MTLRERLRPARRLTLGLLLICGTTAHGEEKLPIVPVPVEPAVLTPPTVDLDVGAEPIGTDDLPTEKVQERYPSRTLKVERFVAQDNDGNFFNHGKFTAWSEDGRMAGRGVFRRGLREGKWTRWFSVSETETAYSHLLALGFEAPFTAQATFAGGEMHGTWTVVDAHKRQVAAWEFENGKRHGLSLWWYPEGGKYREVDYRAGELDGNACEYAPTGEVAKEEHFVHGYCHAVKVEHYFSGEVKSECETLFAKDVLQADDNFWTGKTAVKLVGKVGQDQRHGRYVAWSKEGEKILTGTYVDDRPHGLFTWWHANGNKAIQGNYVEGKQDGLWTWWYENGLKEIAGEYDLGNERGHWRQWTETGRVAESLQILPYEFHDRGPVDLESEPNPPTVDAGTPSLTPSTIDQLLPASFTDILDQATAATPLSAETPSEPAAVAPELLPPSGAIDQASPAARTVKGPVLKPAAPRK